MSLEAQNLSTSRASNDNSQAVNSSGYSYTLDSGQTFFAANEQEVFANCPFLGQMFAESPELAKLTLDATIKGNEMLKSELDQDLQPENEFIVTTETSQEVVTPEQKKEIKTPEFRVNSIQVSENLIEVFPEEIVNDSDTPNTASGKDANFVEVKITPKKIVEEQIVEPEIEHVEEVFEDVSSDEVPVSLTDLSVVDVAEPQSFVRQETSEVVGSNTTFEDNKSESLQAEQITNTNEVQESFIQNDQEIEIENISIVPEVSKPDIELQYQTSESDPTTLQIEQQYVRGPGIEQLINKTEAKNTVPEKVKGPKPRIDKDSIPDFAEVRKVEPKIERKPEIKVSEVKKVRKIELPVFEEISEESNIDELVEIESVLQPENTEFEASTEIEFEEEFLEIKFINDEQKVYEDFSVFLMIDIALLTNPAIEDEEIGELLVLEPKEFEPVTLEMVKYEISEKPLESTFLILSEFLEGDLNLSDEVPFALVMDELRELFETKRDESESDQIALQLTPEITETAIKMLTLLGHANARESVENFIENYGEDTFVSVLDYLTHIEPVEAKIEVFETEGEDQELANETTSVSGFEKKVKPTTEYIRENADDKPLERVLLEFTKVYQELNLNLPENREVEQICDKLGDALKEAPEHVLTPEVIMETKKLLIYLGYEQPEKAMVEFVSCYGSDYLLKALEFMVELEYEKKKNKQEKLIISGGFNPTESYSPHFEIVIPDSSMQFVFLPAA